MCVFPYRSRILVSIVIILGSIVIIFKPIVIILSIVITFRSIVKLFGSIVIILVSIYVLRIFKVILVHFLSILHSTKSFSTWVLCYRPLSCLPILSNNIERIGMACDQLLAYLISHTLLYRFQIYGFHKKINFSSFGS